MFIQFCIILLTFIVVWCSVGFITGLWLVLKYPTEDGKTIFALLVVTLLGLFGPLLIMFHPGIRASMKEADELKEKEDLRHKWYEIRDKSS